MPIKHLIGALSCLPILAACTSEIDRVYSRGIDAYANKRYAEAAPLIKRAAEANHLDGMAILGVMCLYGNGVEKDGRKAETWLSRAAEAGQVSAQSILGMMYATGAGVPKNPQKAQKWLYKAAGEGDKQAIQMLDLLGHDAGAVRL
ncbi:MAG: tetratricopeptide repeat protein [Gammaproteobacteria bacterium]